MNKQGKLYGFLTFIIIIFAGFSLYNSSLGGGQLDVAIVTHQGDSDHLDAVDFTGDIYDSYSYNSRNIFFRSEGKMSSHKDLSFLERMDFEHDPFANRLVTDYRSFMRGKARYENLLAETEDLIVYTGMVYDHDYTQYGSNKMVISILDKNSGEEKDFETNLGTGLSNPYTTVIKTYVNYPELTIITSEISYQDHKNNYLVYKFNLDEPVDTLEAVFNLSDSLEDPSTTISVSSLASSSARYIPISIVDHGEPEFPEEYYDDDIIVEHPDTTATYYIYDVQTNELISIPSFEDEETLVLSDGNKVYIGKDLKETIELHEIDIETQELSLIGTLNMVSPTIGREDPFYYQETHNNSIHITDGKLYAYEADYTTESGRPLFQVIDIESQETVFSGSIEPKDSTDSKGIEIMLHRYQVINDLNSNN